MQEVQLSQTIAALRFDGDANDAATLLGQYGAAEIIANLEREHRQDCRHPWDECMANAIPLSPALTPGIHALVSDACTRLGLTCALRLCTMPGPQINAYAFLDRNLDQPVLSLCLSSRAMEHLSDSELLFLVGHELGHILYEHDRLNLLCNSSQDALAPTVLPDMGEWIFLRWRQKAEISADRLGWFLAGQIEAGVSAMIKSATGLTDKTLTLNTTSIQAFLNEDALRPYFRDWSLKNAPLFSTRLSTLRLLEEVTPSKVKIGNKRPAWLQKMDKEVADILISLSRHPDTTVGLASMHLIADAGVQLLQRDGIVASTEIKKVLTILHNDFTDEPDKVICLDPAKRAIRLKSAIGKLIRGATSSKRKDILSRLADIAISDGPFCEAESKAIEGVAKALKIPTHETYAIIIGCMKTSGKEIDPGIQQLADQLATAAAGM